MVDVSPGVLLGSSLCDVRVQSGVAFELRGQVTPGWFIDSVEPIGDPRKSTRTSTSVAAGPAAGDTQGFDWRVIRGAGGDELLISLPLAAAPGKPVSIRINGHRAGIPAGTSLPALRADMVRLDGEAAGMAWLEFRSSPETTVEVEHAEGGGDRLDPRVAALSGSGGWRARVPVDRLGSTSSIRFLRQRPPIEVRTQIRMGVLRVSASPCRHRRRRGAIHPADARSRMVPSAAPTQRSLRPPTRVRRAACGRHTTGCPGMAGRVHAADPRALHPSGSAIISLLTAGGRAAGLDRGGGASTW
jgi:hypothetical protein